MPADEVISFVAGDDDRGRLDAVLAARAGVSRARAARLIADGSVLVDGEPADKASRVHAGMRVEAHLRPPERTPVPEDRPVRVVLEDEHLLVVAKPAGLVVHPAPGNRQGTLVNALLARDEPPAGGDPQRPGIVHRLDAGTSGLLLVAKNEEAWQALTAALAERRVSRIYLALAEGTPRTDTGTIDGPIGRSPRHRKKMAVVAGGKPAVTRFAVLERHAETSLLEVRPETGRTHQIRVHLAGAGHAVVGDPVYGRRRAIARALDLDRPFLHATRLIFEHPVTGETVDVAEPLPAELERALARARAGP